MRPVTVVDDAVKLADAAAMAVAACALASREAGSLSLVLAGGSTPARLYENLATGPYGRPIDWAHADIFFGDERCVPPDHEDSNYRMAREALLSRVPVDEARVHRMRGEDAPEDAAEQYETAIRGVFGDGAPAFTLTLLGMGADGHTASLFEGSPALGTTERLAMAVDTPGGPRVTLTRDALAASRSILFLVSGEEKAEALARVFGDDEAARPPAARIRPAGEGVHWLVDRAAARLLSS